MPTLSAAQTAALASRNVMRRVFVWIEALDENGGADPAGFWDDVGNITVGGRLYYGSGSLGEVSSLNAVSDLSVTPMVLTLSGIAASVASAIRGSTVGQRPVTISLGIFDVDTRALIGDLVTMFRGYVDDIDIKTGKTGETCTITVVCESIGRELTIGSLDTRNQHSQQLRKSTDTLLKYVDKLEGQHVYFGRQAPRRHDRKKKKHR